MQRRPHTRRGSIYVLVLMVSAMVSIIGISSVFFARIQARVAAMDGTSGHAQHLAVSATEYAVKLLQETAGWQDDVMLDAWYPLPGVGGGRLSARIEDPGPNPGSFEEGVRVYGRAEYDGTVRVISVLCDSGTPGTPRNDLVNGDFEIDTSGWISPGAVIAHETTDVHTGAGSVRWSDRTSFTTGYLQQDVDTSIERSTLYEFTCWIRSDTAPAVTPLFLTDTASSTFWDWGTTRVITSDWMRIEDYFWVPPGTIDADIMLAWTSTAGPIFVDDVIFAPVGAPSTGAQPPAVVPGTWRDELDF